MINTKNSNKPYENLLFKMLDFIITILKIMCIHVALCRGLYMPAQCQQRLEKDGDSLNQKLQVLTFLT